MLKKITKNPVFIRIAAKIISVLLRLIYLTLRFDNKSSRLLAKYKHENIILVFWHGRMLMMPFLWKNPSKMNVLISHHKDGEFIAKVIENLRYKTIRGSSSKGGMKALKDILRILKQESVAITPDGPRGPVYKVGGNLAAISRISGAKIILAVYSAQSRYNLSSWDKMIIPKLFSKATLKIAELTYQAGLTDEEFSNLVENKMNELLFEAEK